MNVTNVTNVTIRTFAAADAPAVIALWREVFPEYGDTSRPHRDPYLSIANKLRTQPELFFVAMRDEAIVGTVMGGFDGHRGWMYSLAVDPRARRLGIGKRLVRHVEAALARLGCPKLNLQILADKPEVLAFYEALGYQCDPVVSLGRRLDPLA